jgi:hypothetical protein
MEPTRSPLPSYVLRFQTPVRGEESELPNSSSPLTRSVRNSESDATLVLATLDQLAAQQAAIEWLREANLFRLILV